MGRENRALDPYDLPQEPELEDVLKAWGRAIKLSIRVHATATIVTYDPATQKAVVQVGSLPVVKAVDPTKIPVTTVSLKGTPPNADATLAPLQLVGIPVGWPATNAGHVTFPLVPGDTGELHVQDRSLEQWMTLGIATDPVLAFTHALKDSVFHPTLRPTSNPIVPPTDLTATVVDGAVSVKIGALAVEPMIKATTFVALMDTAIAAAIIAGTGVPGTTGTLAFTAFQTAWNLAKATILATKGKVE